MPGMPGRSVQKELCPTGLQSFLICHVDADSDHDHSDDILGTEFLVQQKSGKDDSQNRDQSVVDGNLTDRMHRQKGIVDAEADSGDRDQAQQDEDALCRDRPWPVGTCQKPCRDEKAAADLHAVTGCTGDIHFSGNDSCDESAEGGAACVEKDHSISPHCDIRKEILTGIDVDRDDRGNTKNAAEGFFPCHAVIREDRRREDDQQETAHGVQNR